MLLTDPFEILLGAGCRLVAIRPSEAVATLVFSAKRVETAALLAAGWMEIPGDTELAKLVAEGSRDDERKLRLAGARNDAQRKKLAKTFAEEDASVQTRFIETLSRDPVSMAALQRRSDAWVTAAVDGVGIAIDDKAFGVLSGTPELHCQESPEYGYLRPIKFGVDMDLRILPETDRIVLGTLLQSAFAPKDVRPLSRT